jgi:hypothetical protein
MYNSLQKHLAAFRRILNRVHRYVFIERCSETIPYCWENYPQRYDLINAVIARNKAQSYLEIGCRNDECFARIKCARKVGVDPGSGGTLRMFSDEYFARHNECFDVIFIDGLHLFEQVKRDIENALGRLNAGGIVLVHDCLPLNVGAQSRRIEQEGPWNGDVWKAFLAIRTRPEIDSTVCAIDHGMGMIGNRSNRRPLLVTIPNYHALRFSDLVAHHREWLNLIKYEDALRYWAISET